MILTLSIAFAEGGQILISSTAAKILEEQLQTDENQASKKDFEPFDIKKFGEVQLKGFQALETLYQVY